ncbi:MAG: hypothetical protein QM528_03170 [Phycisphaerales bacterium]|nr:hypothetical protein [Phycisphaerales bacterium]
MQQPNTKNEKQSIKMATIVDSSIIAIDGEGDYCGSNNYSIDYIINAAKNMATDNALQKAFGSHISSFIESIDQEVNKKLSSSFYQHAMEETKGELIGIPYDSCIKRFNDHNEICVHCFISGLAKPITNNSSQIRVQFLNAPDAQAIVNTFKDGSNFYLLLESNARVFVRIFYRSKNEVTEIFPYVNARAYLNYDTVYFLPNKKYILFAPGDLKIGYIPASFPDFLCTPLVIKNNDYSDITLDELYILHSTAYIPTPILDGNKKTNNDDEISYIEDLDYTNFKKWIQQVQLQDNRIQYSLYPLIIER